jgi:hypothetical protein
LGTEASKDVFIQTPGSVQQLAAEVIDNNVLLKWTAPASGTLPIEHYKVLKGAEFDSADQVGQVSGTFAVLFELLAGTFTYWVQAQDTAGNTGAERPITAFVDEPPDFVLLDDQDIDLTSTSGVEGRNYYVDAGALYLCVDAGETWEEHFLRNGWTTPQDQIDDGYDYYLQPSAAFGYYEKLIDFGAEVDASIIKFLFTQLDFGGTNDFEVFISYSDDGVTYTEAEGQQVYAQTFRYVKVRIQQGTIPGQSGTLMGISGITYP